MAENKSIYAVISYITTILVFAYLGIGQWIINSELYRTGNYPYFVGKVALESETLLSATLSSEVSTLELMFDQKVDGFKVIKTEDFASSVTAKLDAKGRWMTVSTNESSTGPSSGLGSFAIELFKSQGPGSSSTVRITAARVDKSYMPINEFYENFIVSSESSLKYFVPLDFKHLSSTLANEAGDGLTSVIRYVLLCLLGTQVILFVVGVIWQPPGIAESFEDVNSPSLSFIDRVSDLYAIPLGFLGTLISIWVALETDTTNFDNFPRIIELFKIAIFTSVLGLSVKVACTIRTHRLNLLQSFSK